MADEKNPGTRVETERTTQTETERTNVGGSQPVGGTTDAPGTDQGGERANKAGRNSGATSGGEGNPAESGKQSDR